MIVEMKMDGGLRQGLAWLHTLWQNSASRNERLIAHTEEDYYHSVPIELPAGIDQETLILFLCGLNLKKVSVAGDGESFTYIPGENVGVASSENPATLALARQLPPVNPLPGWSAAPRILTLNGDKKLSVMKLLTLLSEDAQFYNADISVLYHRKPSMENFRGMANKIMTLVAMDSSRHVMVGFNVLLRYLVIWAPDYVALPDLSYFAEN